MRNHQIMWLDVTFQFNILPAIFKQWIPENNKKHVHGFSRGLIKKPRLSKLNVA